MSGVRLGTNAFMYDHLSGEVVGWLDLNGREQLTLNRSQQAAVTRLGNLSGVTWDSSSRVTGFTIDGTTYSIDWSTRIIQSNDGVRRQFNLDPLGRFASVSVIA